MKNTRDRFERTDSEYFCCLQQRRNIRGEEDLNPNHVFEYVRTDFLCEIELARNT